MERDGATYRSTYFEAHDRTLWYEAFRLKVVIGPCISEKNFEVGQEVYDTFAAESFPTERIARMYEKMAYRPSALQSISIRRTWCACS